MWLIAVAGPAPCQCFSPGANQITSPGRISSTAPPSRPARPFLHCAAHPEGATTPDGRIAGTYIHGLFTDDAARAWWLARHGATPSVHRHDAAIEAALDALAAHLETHLDLDRLLSLARA